MPNILNEQHVSNLQMYLRELERHSLTIGGQKALEAAQKELDCLVQNWPFDAEQKRLEALYRASCDLGNSLNLDEVLMQVMDTVIGLTHAERGFLVLLDEEDENWNLHATRNYDQKTLQPIDIEISRAVINTVLENESGLLTTDDRAAPRFSESSSEVAYPLHSIMCAPLTSRGRTIGAIFVDNRAESGLFDQADLELLDAFASQAAFAIENARLYTRAEQALARTVQQMHQAKTQFVSVVTHELRAPMTSIRGYADLLQQGVAGPLSEQQTHFIHVIRNNVDRMSTLVSDLSDISRLESGHLKLSPGMIALLPSIEETAQTLQPRLNEKEQTLKVEIPVDLPQIYADPHRVVQVLTNLTNNACKYTPSNGEIRILASARSDAVRVEVIDKGIGIAPKDQERLFTQFFRSEDPPVREEQGWGLGLYVSKLLVESMGGEMDFESALGKGSVFWFTLPVQPPQTKTPGGAE